MAYVTGEQAGRIEVNVEGQMMQLRPEVVHFDGLDASKEVSEADPHRYLVMPYQARMGDPSGGLLIPDGEFDKWVKGIPRQERTAS